MGELYNPFPKIPKNIRQIGDPDQVVKLYVEDYVNTYLKQLYPSGKQTMRVGLLLGTVEQHDGTPFIFVDGAMEMEDVETEGERIVLTDSAWKKAYQRIEESFPKRTVQGWFLCGGPGSQLSPLNYWKQHGQYFTGRNQLMYLNHGLDGDESVYVTSDDGFYRLKGHSVYYERNQMMQDYMIMRKDVRRVETGSHEKVIKDFRQRMQSRKEQAAVQRSTVSALGMVCSVLTVAVLAGGVVLFNNYQKMRQMESVLTSVLPVGVGSWDEYKAEKNVEPDFIIEELPGNVYPTEAVSGETGESYEAEPSPSSEAEESESEETETPGGETVGAADRPAGETVAEAQTDTAAATAQQPELVGMGKTSGEGDEGDATAEYIEETVPEHPPIDYEAAKENGYEIYEVGEGETLYGICWSVYGDLSRLKEICKFNYLTDENKILAGQKLILP